MLSFLRSLFASAPPVEPTIKSWTELVGHTFSYQNDGTPSQDVVIKQADGLIQVATTRHAPAGSSTANLFLDSDGIIRKCPDYGDRYNGGRDCFWLPLALRTKGARIEESLYPCILQVRGAGRWQGIPVWTVDYNPMGIPMFIHYDQATGVTVGQTGTGKLVKTSLAMQLPN